MYKKDAGREVCATRFTFDQNETLLFQTETAAYQTCSEALPNEHRLIRPEQTQHWQHQPPQSRTTACVINM